MKELTQATLKYLLHYDPDTGIFRWNHRVSQAIQAGMIAGTRTGIAGEARIKINGKSYASSRLTFLYMTGKFPTNVVGHKDGDIENNRWENLQDVIRLKTNQSNQKKRSDTKFLAGITFDKVVQKFVADITMNQKKIRIGTFENIFDAACARKSANNKYNFGGNHGTRKSK